METAEKMEMASTDWYTIYRGDCIYVMQSLPERSVDFCIHSPPFANLYIYSDHEADMGNCQSNEEFIEHYKFCIAEIYRLLVVGRLCAVHCKDLPRYANSDGTAGLIDFPGMIIRAFEECGFSYHSRVTIWKCPVTERERTNNNGLLHKTILRDRSQVRQGMADYLLVFRKPPVGVLMSDKPVTIDVPGEEGLGQYIGDCNPLTESFHPSKYARKKRPTDPSIAIWQRYADPVWWDIDQTDVLNYKPARDDKDERHICPLQLGLVERAVQLWSQPDEIVLSPFAGVGTEGVGSIKLERRFVGMELKQSYYETAKTNCQVAVNNRRARSLF